MVLKAFKGLGPYDRPGNGALKAFNGLLMPCKRPSKGLLNASEWPYESLYRAFQMLWKCFLKVFKRPVMRNIESVA